MPSSAGLPRLRMRSAGGQRIVNRTLAVILAVGVFGIDTFTDIHGAIAVLYVVVLLLAADTMSARGLLAAASGCACLTLVSFGIAHGVDAEPSAILRGVTALAAIAITTALLLRNHAARKLLERANHELTRSENRYRSIFEQARVSLWEQDFSELRKVLVELRDRGVTDLAAHAAARPGFVDECAGLIRTTDVNDATVELLGTSSRAETLGSISRFLLPDDPTRLAVLAALFEGRSRFEGTGQLRRPDGRVLTVIIGIALPDDPHDFDRVVVGLVDVTQRDQMQAALLRTQAELARAARVATVGALSASIAHEVNQPLGALVMNAQTCLRWLRRDPPDIDAAVRTVERMLRDGMRASGIVQRIRGMLVKGDDRLEPVDLRSAAEEVGRLLSGEFATHGARMVLRAARDLPPVEANAIEIQQVLINLLTNGLHAMEEVGPEGRDLLVSVDSPEAGRVRVQVRDHGRGIDPEHLPTLFEPFFTTRTDGMGMGLAICRTAIERHGGDLAGYNHPEGGAVFEFTLPAIARTAQQ